MSDHSAELKKERLKHLYHLEYEAIRATAAFEHAALRPLFLLNGGALIAYLILYGPLRHGMHFWIGKYALVLWMGGLIAATLTAFLEARSQLASRKHRGQEIADAEIELGLRSPASVSEKTRHNAVYAGRAQRYRVTAVAAGIFSLALFVAGFYPAYLSVK
jgi:hypothetical protein